MRKVTSIVVVVFLATPFSLGKAVHASPCGRAKITSWDVSDDVYGETIYWCSNGKIVHR